MGSFSIQFHATREELAAFAEEISTAFKLHVTAVFFPPYSARELDAPEIYCAMQREEIFGLEFTTYSPQGLRGGEQFGQRNPDALSLNVGKFANNSLRQSSISTQTSNVTAARVWREVARRLKSVTTAGVTVCSAHAGVRSRWADEYRYSAGARDLARQGVIMLGVAGTAIMKFE